MLKIALIGSTGMLGIDVNAALKGVNFLLKNYNSKNLDITDARLTLDAMNNFKPDYIINCAAFAFVDLAEEEKERRTPLIIWALKIWPRRRWR
jgi:dTDP-4-dehydrorhamnose reductase